MERWRHLSIFSSFKLWTKDSGWCKSNVKCNVALYLSFWKSYMWSQLPKPPASCRHHPYMSISMGWAQGAYRHAWLQTGLEMRSPVPSPPSPSLLKIVFYKMTFCSNVPLSNIKLSTLCKLDLKCVNGVQLVIFQLSEKVLQMTKWKDK